jgi:hypothetical protein
VWPRRDRSTARAFARASVILWITISGNERTHSVARETFSDTRSHHVGTATFGNLISSTGREVNHPRVTVGVRRLPPVMESEGLCDGTSGGGGSNGGSNATLFHCCAAMFADDIYPF